VDPGAARHSMPNRSLLVLVDCSEYLST